MGFCNDDDCKHESCGPTINEEPINEEPIINDDDNKEEPTVLVCDCCHFDLTDRDTNCPDKRLCDDCFFENLMYGFTEDIIKRKLEDNEYDEISDINEDLDCDEKHKVVNFVMFLLNLVEEEEEEFEFIDLLIEIQEYILEDL